MTVEASETATQNSVQKEPHRHTMSVKLIMKRERKGKLLTMSLRGTGTLGGVGCIT